MDVSRLLKTVDVARELNKDRRTIVRMARDGRLPIAIELPGYRGDLLFDPASVEALREGKAA
jgi:hypothetical protein